MRHVPVTIQVLDVNDNPPEISTEDKILICESIKAGQVGLKMDFSIFPVHTVKSLVPELIYANIKHRKKIAKKKK